MKISKLALWLTISLISLSQAIANDQNVAFKYWAFEPTIVAENIEKYTNETGSSIDAEVITDSDFPYKMEMLLLQGEPLDILYANIFSAVRFYEYGYIEPANTLDNYDEIKNDMFENAFEAIQYKGKLLGLPYFYANRGMTFVNLERQEELGVANSQPKNWDEFYDQLIALQGKGVENTYIPHWFDEYYGLPWAFIWEVQNRGGTQYDTELNEPGLTEFGPAGETLRDWKEIYNRGIVTRRMMNMDESQLIEEFAQGNYLYTNQASYSLKWFNGTGENSIKGKVGFLPNQGQSWGLLDSAQYIRTKKNREKSHEERSKEFQNWLGYKNTEGEFYVADKWTQTSLLFSGYKPVMEASSTKKIFQEYLSQPSDYSDLINIYETSPHPPVWKEAWFEDYNLFLKQKLREYLLDDSDPSSLIIELNDKMSELSSLYN